MAKLNKSAVPVTTVLDQPIEMRDGTILRADVHRPAEGGPFRTVLIRNPYGEPLFRRTPVVPYLHAGLAVVLQHCRGRGSSDGTFTPWVDEPRDGVDTVEWITAQPWSNGEVVASGMSYLAGCALQLAAQRPAALKAVAASMTPHDFYDGLKYHGGAFALGSAFHWGSLQGMLGALHAMSGGEDAGARFGALLPVLADPYPAMAATPLSEAPGVSQAFPFWRDWVEHPERDEYWEKLAETLRHDRIEVPVLHTAGWFDVFLRGTLENFRRIPGGRLIVGPWTHLSQESGVGELNFGFSASAQSAMLEAQQIAWLLGDTAGPRVRYFTMGADTWREAESWPPPGATETRYYLHPGGLLSPEAPAADAEPSRFVHDPDDPVPTHGGPLLLPDPTNAGPRDQRRIEERPDVLCFTTPVLDRDVEVTGPLTVVLHAATSAAGGDWTAKLVDVWPDGRAMSVIDGIVRSAGDRLRHEIDLVATSQTFRAGHRIRVEIASSNFPRFDRHPAMTRAEQTVFHDAGRPSWITLPIMGG
ncbi:CocE/NonD family hydrolase [Thermomonospora cellulosilytica]|uniref:Putative CocE/NonD family hydrolase n=1 Tax=Thermomonospora cellulosilytica TaxID=1411118 RepID=A0A7W3MYD7_9ACTN|nr:CocE/NonD family hydrolase [Thermomonospora cellulosilytica]MBA9004136.1 putative CocE/NonD family hydrolase [Thermomonospora cellulosilytica]